MRVSNNADLLIIEKKIIEEDFEGLDEVLSELYDFQNLNHKADFLLDIVFENYVSNCLSYFAEKGLIIRSGLSNPIENRLYEKFKDLDGEESKEFCYEVINTIVKEGGFGLFKIRLVDLIIDVFLEDEEYFKEILLKMIENKFDVTQSNFYFLRLLAVNLKEDSLIEDIFCTVISIIDRDTSKKAKESIFNEKTHWKEYFPLERLKKIFIKSELFKQI